MREPATLSALLVRLEAMRQAIHAERFRRWDAEYPPGHADREARSPASSCSKPECSPVLVDHFGGS